MTPNLIPLLASLADVGPIGMALWVGFGLFTATLLSVAVTRWGQSRPLRKCVVLSLWAHGLLLLYATTIEVAIKPAGTAGSDATPVALRDDASVPEVSAPRSDEPWEALHGGEAEMVAPSELEKTPDRPTTDETPPTLPADAPAPPTADVSLKPAEAAPADAIEPPTAERREPPAVAMEPQPEPPRPADDAAVFDPLANPPAPRLPTSALPRPTELPRVAEIEPVAEPAQPAPSAGPARSETTIRPSVAGLVSPDAALAPSPELPATAGVPRAPPRREVGGEFRPPSLYQLRTSPERLEQAERQGGSIETEAAVKLALEWLAANQAADGRWDASEHGAGRETQTLGHHRQGAGAQADTGITGLALLAFLGSGHTQVQGTHAATVARGIEFLVRSQAADGSLGGQAEAYAYMYCHGMASLALSEALAMTGDAALRKPVERAIAYTLAAQHPTTGGWRYRPRDLGDTSQLGWQLMALKSAELGGIPVPMETRARMAQFLRSVASGRYGGLASYRPNERVSRTMTAEALVCRQFLGLDGEQGASDEAAQLVLEELPGVGPANFYYWYYATLGMYQAQGAAWQRWNGALSTTLVTAQRREGRQAGSWDPDPVWGGYGGRVYSTALGTLCLEVYYRYLPLHVQAAARERRIK